MFTIPAWNVTATSVFPDEVQWDIIMNEFTTTKVVNYLFDINDKQMTSSWR